MKPHPRIRRVLLAGLALFTGAALVAHLTVGISLPTALTVLGVTVVAAGVAVLAGASVVERRLLLARCQVGAAAGVVATVGYDAAKLAVARLIRASQDPFGTIRLFGILLAGRAASPAAAYAAGVAYHFLNGATFGIGFSILLGRRGALAGIAWGFGLELMQVLLYPRWLHLNGFNALGEFTAVSAAGHATYGFLLGSLCRAGLDRVAPFAAGVGARVVAER
jgi:hypothetical protein